MATASATSMRTDDRLRPSREALCVSPSGHETRVHDSRAARLRGRDPVCAGPGTGQRRRVLLVRASTDARLPRRDVPRRSGRHLRRAASTRMPGSSLVATRNARPRSRRGALTFSARLRLRLQGAANCTARCRSRASANVPCGQIADRFARVSLTFRPIGQLDPQDDARAADPQIHAQGRAKRASSFLSSRAEAQAQALAREPLAAERSDEGAEDGDQCGCDGGVHHGEYLARARGRLDQQGRAARGSTRPRRAVARSWPRHPQRGFAGD